MPKFLTRLFRLRPTETWHISTMYLRPGSKLWCSRGWFEVRRLTPRGVVVSPA